jgi:hypothetical protein
MLDRIFKRNIHQTIQFIACIALAVGLPWSKIPLSLATALLGLNVVLLNDWKKVFKTWISNRTILFLFLFIAFEWLSLLWSNNLNYGLDDVRKKLPLFAIPLCLAVIPLTIQQWKLVSFFFLSSLFITSFLNYGFYSQWFGQKNYTDFRQLSLFISHIRLALLLVAGLVLCVFWWIRKERFRFLALPFALWFLFYTNVSQVGFGFVGLGIAILFGFVILLLQIKKNSIRIAAFAVLLIGSVCIAVYVVQELQPMQQKVKLVQQPEYTKSGNKYEFWDEPYWENGYPICFFICEKELKVAWGKRSKIAYESGSGNEQLRFVLWHFMASKNLKKDKEGIEQLTDSEIKAIESKIPSVEMMKGGFHARFYEIRNQLGEKDPNGKSLLMRLLYLKTGWNIACNNFPLGVGAGDVEDAFNSSYSRQNFGLKKANWKRVHNQFLTVLISSGLIGMLFFLLIWFSIFRESVRKKSPLFFLLTLLVLCSFLSEDTIESQTGVTIAAFLIGAFANYFSIQKNSIR